MVSAPLTCSHNFSLCIQVHVKLSIMSIVWICTFLPSVDVVEYLLLILPANHDQSVSCRELLMLLQDGAV